MAERTVVPRAFCFSVPSELDDDAAAALPNPGVSAWLTLAYRAKLVPGETVLILGATGVTGQLAMQIAKLLGAKRVAGAGRNERMLERLREMGADARMHSHARRGTTDSTSSLITCGDILRKCCLRRLQNRISRQ
jgi:NADPH2:quinone reductase